MGLAEKRALKEFQKANYAKCVESVARLCGKDVPVDVDWDALQAHVSAEKTASYWDETFFMPLVSALEQICADEIGQESVNEQLQRVKIKGAIRHVYTVRWSGGQLAIDLMIRDDSAVGGPGTKTYKDRVAEIVKVIEENLA